MNETQDNQTSESVESVTIDGNDIPVYNSTDAPVRLADLPACIIAPEYDGQCYSMADDCWSDGLYSLYQYRLADGRYLYLDQDEIPMCLTISTDTPLSHLQDWDCGDADPDEWLSEWGFAASDILVAVADDYDGPCRVWHDPCYYSGHNNAPAGTWATDDSVSPPEDRYPDGDSLIHVFASRAEAEAYVDRYKHEPSGYDGILACNVLSHGQYASDTLTIVATD